MMMMQRQTLASQQLRSARRSLTASPANSRPVAVARGLLDKDSRHTGLPGSPDPAIAPEDQKKVEFIGVDNSILGVSKPVITPQNAEARADLGISYSNIGELQAFDGPAPETINSRLAMLGVVIALAYEASTGMNIWEQVADHPWTVAMVFAVFMIASYVPILKGFTRKEAFANGLWTPKAENWNGRLAQMAFLVMVLVETFKHTTALQFFGLGDVLGAVVRTSILNH